MVNTRRIHAFAVFVLMVLAFAGAYAWTPTKFLADTVDKVDLEALFPKTFGEWRMDDRGPVQVVSPDQQALLNKIYNQTLSRLYVNRHGDRVMLSVAYGGDQSDGTRAHRPEVCYPAQGFQILSNQVGEVRLDTRAVPARKLVAQQGSRIEPITYWVTVGSKVALSGLEQKLAQLRYSVRGVVPDGMLVRVSTIDKDSAQAYRVQEEFLRELGKSLSADSRDRVFGDDAN